MRERDAWQALFWLAVFIWGVLWLFTQSAGPTCYPGNC